MSSIVPGFEYDIFISYRHNDNLDGEMPTPGTEIPPEPVPIFYRDKALILWSIAAPLLSNIMLHELDDKIGTDNQHFTKR